MVIIEDTPELQCSLPNHIQLLATRAITQADLLVAALRLIPKRLVVGEVREPEPAKVLLSAWNTGHSGGLATIHADNGLAGLVAAQTGLGIGEPKACGLPASTQFARRRHLGRLRAMLTGVKST